MIVESDLLELTEQVIEIFLCVIISFSFFWLNFLIWTDGPTIVDINLMFRGISAISDNKMVRKTVGLLCQQKKERQPINPSDKKNCFLTWSACPATNWIRH